MHMLSRAARTPETTAHTRTSAMSKRPLGNQIVKLIVGAGQAAPTPPVGPALGSKGVKSMDFCKACCSPACPTTTAVDNYFPLHT